MRLHFSSCRRRTHRGFSLLEVMVAVAILAIIASIGLFGFQTMFESARTRAATGSFLASINLARSEAVTRNAFTRVCVTASCGQGVNEIRVLVAAADGSETLLRTWEAERNVAYQSGGADGVGIRFSPLGLAVDGSGGQLASGLSVSILDTSAGTPVELSAYCISVTGSVAEGGCNG